jgi:hypothetical protein
VGQGQFSIRLKPAPIKNPTLAPRIINDFMRDKLGLAGLLPAAEGIGIM